MPAMRSVLVFLVTVLFAHPVVAHEFWIEPEQYQVDSGAAVTAHLKNGENFEGFKLSYLKRRFDRFEQLRGDEITPVEGRTGDLPAVNIADAPDGLLVLGYRSSLSKITYKEWTKFGNFARHKDFPGVRERHAARGLPEAGFTEGYIRFPKALIGVGDAAGADRAFGLETEFVALANPYAPGFTGPLPVQLFYRGAPRTDAQVEAFVRAPDGSVTIEITRTDAQGKALIPVKPGHEYMLDAVLLREPDPALAAEKDIVWESLWATLTFLVPAR